MFTKNFYRGMHHAFCMDAADYVPDGLVNIFGETPSSWGDCYQWVSGMYRSEINGYYYASPIYRAINSKASYGGVVFGSGTTPPTFNDYWLSGDMFTTFEYHAVHSATYDSDGITMSATFTLTNTGDSDFTIGEIGIIAGTVHNARSEYKCLLERTALETPITIPAGGVGQVTYTIRMAYPAA